MKEISVHCNLYMIVDDNYDLEQAFDCLLMHLDPDVAINPYDYEFSIGENGERRVT